MLIYGLCVANMRCAYIKACNNKGMYRMWAYITALYVTAMYITVGYIRYDIYKHGHITRVYIIGGIYKVLCI